MAFYKIQAAPPDTTTGRGQAARERAGPRGGASGPLGASLCGQHRSRRPEGPEGALGPVRSFKLASLYLQRPACPASAGPAEPTLSKAGDPCHLPGQGQGPATVS